MSETPIFDRMLEEFGVERYEDLRKPFLAPVSPSDPVPVGKVLSQWFVPQKAPESVEQNLGGSTTMAPKSVRIRPFIGEYVQGASLVVEEEDGDVVRKVIERVRDGLIKSVEVDETMSLKTLTVQDHIDRGFRPVEEFVLNEDFYTKPEFWRMQDEE